MISHFLLAEWNNLVVANYVVPKEILTPYIPFKTELDLYEGEAYVSLVGFMFLNTRMMGFSIPLHINFEEVNLRFYVSYREHGFRKRGVVFIKAIAPKYAISFVANNIYRQHYVTMKMRHFYRDQADSFEAGYEWKNKDNWNHISASATKKSVPVAKGRLEEFISDHYWGYIRYNESKTLEYEVEHPQWATFPVTQSSVDCDFGSLFGPEFALLDHSKPQSVLMVKGSEIRVHRKNVVE